MLRELRPGIDDVPVNETATVTLAGGTEATVTFSPIQNVTEHAVVCLAASKEPNTTYGVTMDDTPVYGPSAIPPTDIDDTTQVWVPPRAFDRTCQIRISNTGSTVRTYTVQLIGWEVSENLEGAA